MGACDADLTDCETRANMLGQYLSINRSNDFFVFPVLWDSFILVNNKSPENVDDGAHRDSEALVVLKRSAICRLYSM